MYILQEEDGNGFWFDKYKSSDYQFIVDLLHNYFNKYEGKKYRVVEVFIYV